MNSGRLSDRVTIQEDVGGSTYAGAEEEWQDIADDPVRWASVTTMEANSSAAFMQAHNSEVTHRVEFRQPFMELDLDKNSILWRGRRLRLTSPGEDPQGDRRFISYLCVEDEYAS